jgi:hypothetical protein
MILPQGFFLSVGSLKGPVLSQGFYFRFSFLHSGQRLHQSGTAAAQNCAA